MRSALVPVLLADPIPWALKAPYAWDFLKDRARFAGGYRGGIANTPNWTFTRASTGYAQTSAGVLVPFASGELRRTDKGVLIEGARTNLLTKSQELDHSDWTKQRVTVSANAATAPDGTVTADKLIEDATAANTHRAFQAPTVAGVAHAFSVFAKAAERSWIYLRIDRGAGGTPEAWFNLATGAIGAVGTGLTATIVALANGWYHCRIVVDATPASAVNPIVGITTGNSVSSYDGDGTSGVYLWGAQLEAAAYASSYVPTTTGSATRAADSLTVTGVSGLDYPLTLYAEFERASTVSSWSGALLTVSDGTVAERAFLAGDGSATAKLNAQSRKASAVEGNVSSAATLSVGAVYKGAARFTTNDVNIALSGAAGTADTTATNPTAPTQINFGANVAGANPFYGYLRRLAIFSRALSDGELQALTT